MDNCSKYGLPQGWRFMIILFVLLLPDRLITTAILTENGTQAEPSEGDVAQRRDHSFNADGTVNYHGSGSGQDSGDLVPPPNGGGFNHGPTGLSDSYGAPIPSDSYGTPKGVFSDSFGSPPADSYGPPPRDTYGPPAPKPVYGPPKPQYRPPSPSKQTFGPPSVLSPPKFSYGPPRPHKAKISFSKPRPGYGPPKPSFSQGTLLSPVSSQYGPPKPSLSYGTPLAPSTSYGPPSGHSPPTPPEIKYDGWKPMPGLISQPPSSHGSVSWSADISPPTVVQTEITHGHAGDFGDSFPPPPSSSYGSPSFSSGPSSSYGPPPKPSSSYGPPSKPSSSYGPPSFTPPKPSSSYGPPSKSPSFSFSGLPSPSYIPPSKPSFLFGSSSSSYGPPRKPSSTYGSPKPKPSYGIPLAPSVSYGPPPSAPSSSYEPPKLPSLSFGSLKPPSSSHGPLKPPSSSYGPPKLPSSSYGPPKPPGSLYGPPKSPSLSYGPPKTPGFALKPPSSSYSPPKPLSSSYGPPKLPSSSYGPPKPPSSSYGPPKPPSSSYGPPKPPSSSYGPPKPPSTSYGTPNADVSFPSSSYGPPSGGSISPQSSSHGGSQLPLDTSYGVPPSDSYGPPTASAPLIGGCCGTPPPDLSLQAPSQDYGAPPASVPAAPAVEYGAPIASVPAAPPSIAYGPPVQTIQAVPAVEYGAPQITTAISTSPSLVYGTPLLPTVNTDFSVSSPVGVGAELPLQQPKHPVKFRPPVPVGLISSLGAKWGNADAWGGSAHAHKFHGNTYIPPAVPDPDPGTQANKEPALVVPPPSAPSVNYGAPDIGSHQYSSDLNPPPPPSSSYDLQHPSVDELSPPTSYQETSSGYNAPSLTSYNAPVSSTGGGTIQNIPIKGNQGSYTLQIQPAGGNPSDSVHHEEVLSNGLLQDILAAIENPNNAANLRQYGNEGAHAHDPTGDEIGQQLINQLSFPSDTQIQQAPGGQYGSDLIHASSNNIATYEKPDNRTVLIPKPRPFTSSAMKNSTTVDISKYLSDNKVALYFKTHHTESGDEKRSDAKDILLVQMLPDNSTSVVDGKSGIYPDLVSYTIENAQNGTRIARSDTSEES